MLPILFIAILATSSVLGTEYDLHGDANIYSSVMHSLEYDREVLQHASSVCYDQLGCFDKEGTFKHLKQLPEPPETVNTQFLLYTQSNRMEPQILDYKKPETVLNSNLDLSKPLKFMTHGFGGRNNLTWLFQMKNAFLEMHDVNIVVVDWSLGARVPYYIQASVNSELVGAEIAVMFFFMKDKMGAKEENLHLVGFSLGAQVMGFVGKRMKEMRGTRPARITGLDPASPLFEEYGGEVHLWKEDADFVDVVHTNADLLIYGGVGMGQAIGHVDFYPNGGKRQPGCGATIKGAFIDMFKGERERTCNHERAVHLYTDSILRPEECLFVGYQCANYSEFTNGRCLSCGDGCGRMGYHVEGRGIYYLVTRKETPFCSPPTTVTVHFAKDIKKSFGLLMLTLVGHNGAEENVTLTEKDEKLLPGDSRTTVVTLGDGMRPLREVRALYQRYNGWITKGSLTYALQSILIQDTDGAGTFKTCLEDSMVLEDNIYKTVEAC